MTVEIVFCEGWDPATRSIAHPLPEAVARERDAAGEQYAIVFMDERPLVLVEIGWAAHHAAVWYFDEQARRDRELVFRRWPRRAARAAVRPAVGPRTGEPRVPHRRAGVAPAVLARDVRGGRLADGVVAQLGRAGARGALGPPDAGLRAVDAGRRRPRPGDHGARPGRLDPAAELAAELPWRPPLPLRPRQLDDTFEKGARFELDDGAAVTVELATGGVLRLPSGRLVVGDPDPWLHEVVPFEETVPPGEYPLHLSVVRFADSPDHTRVAACALWVSDRPTTSWNNAWREGEHPLRLGDGELLRGRRGRGPGRARRRGGGGAAYEDLIEDAYDEMSGWAHELAGPGDANLITVSSGWGDGSYPVWVGRDEDGELTCFVVDFLVLAAATRLG